MATDWKYQIQQVKDRLPFGHNWPNALNQAIIDVASGGNPNHRGDHSRGLMEISTYWVGKKRNGVPYLDSDAALLDPQTNIAWGLFLLDDALQTLADPPDDGSPLRPAPVNNPSYNDFALALAIYRGGWPQTAATFQQLRDRYQTLTWERWQDWAGSDVEHITRWVNKVLAKYAQYYERPPIPLPKPTPRPKPFEGQVIETDSGVTFKPFERADTVPIDDDSIIKNGGLTDFQARTRDKPVYNVVRNGGADLKPVERSLWFYLAIAAAAGGLFYIAVVADDDKKKKKRRKRRKKR